MRLCMRSVMRPTFSLYIANELIDIIELLPADLEIMHNVLDFWTKINISAPKTLQRQSRFSRSPAIECDSNVESKSPDHRWQRAGTFYVCMLKLTLELFRVRDSIAINKIIILYIIYKCVLVQHINNKQEHQYSKFIEVNPRQLQGYY